MKEGKIELTAPATDLCNNAVNISVEGSVKDKALVLLLCLCSFSYGHELGDIIKRT